jgi:hypothetical protein
MVWVWFRCAKRSDLVSSSHHDLHLVALTVILAEGPSCTHASALLDERLVCDTRDVGPSAAHFPGTATPVAVIMTSRFAA